MSAFYIRERRSSILVRQKTSGLVRRGRTTRLADRHAQETMQLAINARDCKNRPRCTRQVSQNAQQPGCRRSEARLRTKCIDRRSVVQCYGDTLRDAHSQYVSVAAGQRTTLRSVSDKSKNREPVIFNDVQRALTRVGDCSEARASSMRAVQRPAVRVIALRERGHPSHFVCAERRSLGMRRAARQP